MHLSIMLNIVPLKLLCITWFILSVILLLYITSHLFKFVGAHIFAWLPQWLSGKESFFLFFFFLVIKNLSAVQET